MPRPSHAARRAAPTLRRDFPLAPTLPVEGVYDGLVFIVAVSAPLPDLRPLRDTIAAIRHGPLGDDARLVLVALRDPCGFAADDWPGALRLRADGTTLRSFSPDSGMPVGRVQRPVRIELWWAGASYRIALDMLTPIGLASLWDQPVVTVHPSHPFDAIADPVSTEPSAGSPQRYSPLSHAPVPASEGNAAMDAMAGDLRALPGRDRVAAMAAKLRSQLATRVVGQGGASAAPSRPNQPGMLDAMLGWLRWHTPLGEGLKRAYGERMSVVEKLIASGEIDRALQLALMLGTDKGDRDKPPTRYPNQLPQARASLDLDITPAAFAAPILGDASFDQMRRHYLDLARKLAAEGDVHRAAFIHAQLLGDYREAALVLERGEAFAEAARLALGARLDPVITIRLLYRADRLDAALALAKRTGCFEALAADSAGKEAYHAYVVRAWTHLLVATGQPLRAIHVTDALAKREAAESPLHDLRREWLAAALDQSGDAPDGELIARALLSARWDGTDLDPRGLDAFPHRPATRDPNAFEAAFDRLQAAARGAGESADTLLLATLAGFARVGDTSRPEQAGFWQGAAAVIVEGMARALLAVAAARIVPRDLGQLHALLEKAGLPVFAEDLGKLRRLHRPTQARSSGPWRVPPPLARQAAIRHACLIANGSVVIWREDGRLQLLDRDGAVVWQAAITGVAGLVAVGTSPSVLVIQQEQDGTRLTRFASDRRTFHPIGMVDLRAHHSITSESHWLVQIGGAIGALDLVKLCARAPEIEFAWSCSLTDRLRALAFAHRPAGASWITCDISPGRAGILERWTIDGGGTMATEIGIPAATHAVPVPAPGAWFWDARANRIGSIATPSLWMPFHPWSDEAEDRARALQRQRAAGGMEGVEDIHSCDLGQAFVRHTAQPDGGSDLAVHRTDKPWAAVFTLACSEDTPLRCVARGVPSETQAAQLLFADEAGRLFLVEPDTQRVTIQ